MSLDFVLEVEKGLSAEKLFALLNKMNVTQIGEDVWLNDSGLRILIGGRNYDSQIATENSGLVWEVGIRCYAIMRTDSWTECWNDLIAFMNAIANNYDQRFILSFEYASIYAIRDECGVHFLQKAVVDESGSD